MTIVMHSSKLEYTNDRSLFFVRVSFSWNGIGQYNVSLMNFLNERLLIFIAYNFRRQDWSSVRRRTSKHLHFYRARRFYHLHFSLRAATVDSIDFNETEFQYAQHVVYDVVCVFFSY